MATDTPAVGRYTAIMTETDRERISGESDDPPEKKYQAVSRVRQRIDALETDVAILREYHPELLGELRAVVCKENE